MTKGIFITATGTDTGKTYISALIVKKMKQLGMNCGYFKPVLSGAENISGEIIPGDCDYVVKQAHLDKKPEECTSYIFETPVSPHLAAKLENRNINTNKIIQDFNNTKKQYDYIVTEGAGGITCPLCLDPIVLMSDLIKELGINIILVADAGLGTINSTLLTVEYAKKCNIKIKGIILNNYDNKEIMHRDNKESIEYLTGIKVIATVRKNEPGINITNNEIPALFEEI